MTANFTMQLEIVGELRVVQLRLDRDGFEMSTGSAVGHAHEFRAQACGKGVAGFRREFGNVRQGKCKISLADLLFLHVVMLPRGRKLVVFWNGRLCASAVHTRVVFFFAARAFRRVRPMFCARPVFPLCLSALTLGYSLDEYKSAFAIEIRPSEIRFSVRNTRRRPSAPLPTPFKLISVHVQKRLLFRFLKPDQSEISQRTYLHLALKECNENVF